jgi:beta-mannosidase
MEAVSGARINGFYVYTKDISEAKASVGIEVTAENLCEYSSDDSELDVKIKYGEEVVWSRKESLHLNGGLSYWDCTAEISSPKLWWPNGMGRQDLYTIEIEIICRGFRNAVKPFKFGIRTIKLNQDRINDKERFFAFEVNGIKTFCKGGNWVPADSVYLRVTDEKYDTLVKEAAGANFNMLRMWGGGLYEPDIFYEKCSEYGIMLMHDFMYSCAFYPDHLDWFAEEARKEADFQTKRLRNYPCMAVWTGNNEIHESITDWFLEKESLDTFYGAKIFNYIQPEAVRNNCRYIPYQPSTPFGGPIANSQEIGDSHVWRWVGRDPETRLKFLYELEGFDRLYTKFMSEYGFHGPMKKSSVARFHENEEIVYQGSAWIHHGEQERKHNNIAAAINRHLIDAALLDMDGYLLYGGLMQGCLYKELAESLRFKKYCYGNLIWMYNDCWPETGWTIIDYYLTRKISYYFLKRAFANTMFIIRGEGNTMHVVGINETPNDMEGNVQYGYISFDGAICKVETAAIRMPAFTRNTVLSFDCTDDLRSGTCFVKPVEDNEVILPAVSLRSYFRDYTFSEPSARITGMLRENGITKVVIKAENFIPFVYLDLEDDIKLSDNYFSMLPGEERTIDIYRILEDGDIQLKFARTMPN